MSYPSVDVELGWGKGLFQEAWRWGAVVPFSGLNAPWGRAAEREAPTATMRGSSGRGLVRFLSAKATDSALTCRVLVLP
ncbi:hypothetical protein [Streptomyces sp. NPDC018321]|uniref:hypothetical protein n=1 Tax=unclassified Streptomyces TaxID=2593676 RepID=UPI0037A8E00E